MLTGPPEVALQPEVTLRKTAPSGRHAGPDGPPAGRGGRFRPALPGLAALLLGALALGPGLAPGYILSYDMVFVPDPVPNEAMFGTSEAFPRQVPSDAAVAALAVLLPADVVQKLVLLTVFTLAGAGAARLVPSGRTAARVAAAVFYVWNPYVAERLLLGHWALLLGYAGLPWVLRAAASGASRRGAVRLAAALLPAAVGGFAAWNVSALTAAGGVLGDGPHRPFRWRPVARRAAVAAGALVAVALPWLVPALLGGGPARSDPAGADLFAARADTPFGTLGSLVSLGGIWNAEVVPPGYGTWPTAAGRLVLSVVAVCGFALTVRRGGRPELRGLALSAAVGLALASLAVTGPGLAVLRGLIGWWPAFGVLRDAHVYIAPLALLQAVGAAAVVAALLRRTDAALAGLVLVAPVALLPGLAWGASGTLRPVDYPADWARARTLINADPVPGRVLSLPWGGYHRYSWNHGRTLLDPLPRMVERHVVWNDGLRVGDRALAPETRAAREAAALLAEPGPLARRLATAGYRYVVLERSGDPAEPRIAERLRRARVVLAGPHLTVFRLPPR